MPNYLSESDSYTPGVYQLEITDPVLGGPEGTSNKPLKDLANRTVYLKNRVDEILEALFKNSIYADPDDFEYLGQGIDFNAEFSGVSQSWKPVYRDEDGLYKLAITDGTSKQKGVGFSYFGDGYNAVIFSGLVNTDITDFNAGDDVYLSEDTPGLVTTTRTPLNLGVMVDNDGLMLLNTGAGSSDIMLDRFMEDLRGYPDALASSMKSGLIRSTDQVKLNSLGTAAHYDVGSRPSDLVTREMLDFTVEIDPNHDFTDEDDRDSYFSTNSEELEDGLFIRVTDVLYKYRSSDSAWLEVVEGPMGPQGEKGEDGESGFLAVYQGDWSSSSAPYAQFQAVKHANNYWVSNIDGNSNEPGTDNSWDIWLPEGTTMHRDFHSYQNWDSEIGYNEYNQIEEIVSTHETVQIKENYVVHDGVIIATAVNRSLDSGNSFTVLGTEVLKYKGTSIIGTKWWAERGTDSDLSLLKVNYLVGFTLDDVDNWVSIVDSFSKFDIVLKNSDAFNILKLTEDANTAVKDTTNAVDILDSNGPVDIPTASDDMDGRITASTESSGGEAWKAFDGSLGSGWNSSTGDVTDQWIGFEFLEPTWLYKVGISPHDSDASPKNCRLQYFDGTSWVETASFTLADNYQVNQEFKVAYPVKATKWRLYVDDNYGNTDTLGVTRLQFYGF